MIKYGAGHPEGHCVQCGDDQGFTLVDPNDLIDEAQARIMDEIPDPMTIEHYQSLTEQNKWWWVATCNECFAPNPAWPI